MILGQRSLSRSVNLPDMHGYRCLRCDRLLFRGALPPGSVVEVKCQCNAFTLIDGRVPKTEQAASDVVA